MNVVMTIAGSDSGGGAGIQADLKTFEALGVFGTSAITAVTAQNTVSVRAVFNLPSSIIRDQIAAVFDDFDVRAVKIGMLSSEEIVEAVACELESRAAGIPVVLDPVMVATSGDLLINDAAVDALKRRLLPLASVVTPNAGEAEILAGSPVTDVESARFAARAIQSLGVGAVLVKGGHIASSDGVLVDLLLDGEQEHLFRTEQIATTSTHGTGCTMSSAIAALLATGATMPEAVRRAQAYVHGAIRCAPGLGGGHGPLLHAWAARP